MHDAAEASEAAAPSYASYASSSAADDEPTVAGAGIVPVAIHDGVVHALLGREKYIRGWSSSLKWSGFEGGSNPHETPIRNAVRECIEESLGTFSTAEKLYRELNDESYIAKVVIRTPSSGKIHVTYFKLIDYDPTIPIKFSHALTYLHDIQQMGSRLRIDRRGWRRRSATGASKADEADRADRAEAAGAASSSEHNAATVERHFSGEDGWTTVKSNNQISETRTRNAIERLLTSPPAHLNPLIDDAIRVERDASGQLVRVNVREEFIEKSQIRFWPLSELRAAIVNGGNGLPDTAIRPFFCIVAQMLCSCLPNRVDPTHSLPETLSLNGYWRGRGGRGALRPFRGQAQVRHLKQARAYRHPRRSDERQRVERVERVERETPATCEDGDAASQGHER